MRRIRLIDCLERPAVIIVAHIIHIIARAFFNHRLTPRPLEDRVHKVFNIMNGFFACLGLLFVFNKTTMKMCASYQYRYLVEPVCYLPFAPPTFEPPHNKVPDANVYAQIFKSSLFDTKIAPESLRRLADDNANVEKLIQQLHFIVHDKEHPTLANNRSLRRNISQLKFFSYWVKFSAESHAGQMKDDALEFMENLNNNIIDFCLARDAINELFYALLHQYAYIISRADYNMQSAQGRWTVPGLKNLNKYLDLWILPQPLIVYNVAQMELDYRKDEFLTLANQALRNLSTSVKHTEVANDWKRLRFRFEEISNHLEAHLLSDAQTLSIFPGTMYIWTMKFLRKNQNPANQLRNTLTSLREHLSDIVTNTYMLERKTQQFTTSCCSKVPSDSDHYGQSLLTTPGLKSLIEAHREEWPTESVAEDEHYKYDFRRPSENHLRQIGDLMRKSCDVDVPVLADHLPVLCRFQRAARTLWEMDLAYYDSTEESSKEGRAKMNDGLVTYSWSNALFSAWKAAHQRHGVTPESIIEMLYHDE